MYRDHHDVIDHHGVPTVDFRTGAPAHRQCARAKVIDEILFIEAGGTISTL
jgi:hypothetical protein